MILVEITNGGSRKVTPKTSASSSASPYCCHPSMSNRIPHCTTTSITRRRVSSTHRTLPWFHHWWPWPRPKGKTVGGAAAATVALLHFCEFRCL
mmetsp:Transcript_37557/g.42873  ORF Transcript_37557/g.42873 Transcript_37557/m.42873 type:complete len:94 (-) Transcript_37557:653-934(-)